MNPTEWKKGGRGTSKKNVVTGGGIPIRQQIGRRECMKEEYTSVVFTVQNKTFAVLLVASVAIVNRFPALHLQQERLSDTQLGD